MAKIFYDADADLGRLAGRKIAVIGYGSQGHAHALNLRESGVKDLVVGLQPNSASKPKAEQEGLKVVTPTEAAVVAVVYSLIVGMFIYRELSPKALWHATLVATKTTGAVMFLVAAAVVALREDDDLFDRLPQWAARAMRPAGWGVVTLAALAAALLLGWNGEQYRARESRSQRVPGIDAPLLVTHSAAGLLENPLLKRASWADIQAGRSGGV